MAWKYKSWMSPIIDEYINEWRSDRDVNIDTGKVSLSGCIIDEVPAILYSSIEKREDTNPHALHAAVGKALFSADLPEYFDGIDLLKQIGRQYSLISKSAGNQYVMFSRLSVELSGFPKFIDHKGARIFFDSVESKKVQKFQRHQMDCVRAVGGAGVDLPSFGKTAVRVAVNAPNREIAMHDAEARLDEIRGLMNLVVNRTKLMKTTFGNTIRTPINQIIIDPVRTLHHSDGKPIPNIYWSDSGWVKPENTTAFSDEESLKRDHFFKMYRRLKTEHALAQMSWRALRMYARALDTIKWRDVLLQLWPILEYLSQVGESEDHKKVVSRTSAWYQKSPTVIAELHHLRQWRNECVHKGEEVIERDAHVLAYQANRFVCEWLTRCIMNSLNFSSIGELRRFVDMPQSAAALDEIVRVSAKVKRFRSL